MKIHKHTTREYHVTIDGETARHKPITITFSQWVNRSDDPRAEAIRRFNIEVANFPRRFITLTETVVQYVPGHGINSYQSLSNHNLQLIDDVWCVLDADGFIMFSNKDKTVVEEWLDQNDLTS